MSQASQLCSLHPTPRRKPAREIRSLQTPGLLPPPCKSRSKKHHFFTPYSDLGSIQRPYLKLKLPPLFFSLLVVLRRFRRVLVVIEPRKSRPLRPLRYLISCISLDYLLNPAAPRLLEFRPTAGYVQKTREPLNLTHRQPRSYLHTFSATRSPFSSSIPPF